jgi:hypothetical protein
MFYNILWQGTWSKGHGAWGMDAWGMEHGVWSMGYRAKCKMKE